MSQAGPTPLPEPDGEPRLTPLREMQLVEAYRRGDAEALADLVRAYQRRVYGVCYRMVRDPDEASDLTQDALIRVIEGLGSYDGRSKLSTWVIRVTMNVCLSHLRKQKLRRHGSLDDPAAGGGGTWAQNLPSPAGRGELPGTRRVEQAELQVVLQAALDRVDPVMRAVLVLRDLQDLNYQQIAEVLDLPVGTVKSRLFRAREALRAALEGGPDRDEGPEEDD
jgi:RNA polymerase sigma-70 factor (ECF subfamily)